MQPPPMVPRITCISVVGRLNNPLHIATFPPSNTPPDTDQTALLLNYHFLTHTTLDIFTLRLPLKTADCDFGLLYAISEDLSAYGWLTNTGVKLIVFVSCIGVGAAGGVREGELKGVFKELQTAYIALVCNPFYDADNGERRPIRSKKFIGEVKRIAESWVPSSAVGLSTNTASAAGAGAGAVTTVGGGNVTAAAATVAAAPAQAPGVTASAAGGVAEAGKSIVL